MNPNEALYQSFNKPLPLSPRAPHTLTPEQCMNRPIQLAQSEWIISAAFVCRNPTCASLKMLMKPNNGRSLRYLRGDLDFKSKGWLKKRCRRCGTADIKKGHYCDECREIIRRKQKLKSYHKRKRIARSND